MYNDCTFIKDRLKCNNTIDIASKGFYCYYLVYLHRVRYANDWLNLTLILSYMILLSLFRTMNDRDV